MNMISTAIADLFDWIGKKRRRDMANDTTEYEADNLSFQQPDELDHKRRKLLSTEGTSVSVQPKCEIVSPILDWLEDDKVNTIGIYGMGGIGKTTLMKQLHYQFINHAVLSSETDSRGVAWVSVGLNFTIYNLQRQIAEAVGLDFQEEKDLNRRAARLYAFLIRLSWRIFFLDDLWSEFRVEQVGIPKQCKLILISRSLDICCTFRCQKVIKVDPLPQDEAWQLFYRTAGNSMLDSKDILVIGKKLCDLCGGVPLAINVLAKRMRGVADASGWRKALYSINQISGGETCLDDTFSSLRRSYDSLSNAKLKTCLLYCALYPRGYAIRKEELIRLWIGETLIDDVESLQAQYDMGHAILNKLLNSSLLETSDDESMVKIHDLIKFMSLSIAGDSFWVAATSCFMMNPTKLECWENLKVLSLIKSICPVPFGAPPKCPSLSTLLLQHSCLYELPDSIFVHMSALRVLNLSHTFLEKLPSSISELHELQCLDISYCRNLRQVPSIAKLKQLRYLNLSQTAIRQAPHGLDMLKRLTELKMCSAFDQLKAPWGVLFSLSRLKRLSCGIINSVELQSLKSLEILDTKFANCIDLSNYVRSHLWRTLKSFHLHVGHIREATRPYSKTVSLHGCSLEYIVLPDNIQEFNVDDCQGLRNLTGILNLVDCSTQTCDELLVYKEQCGLIRQASPFSSLEICTISRCHDVEQLFTAGLIQKLPRLESIVIEDCKKLKEIIADEVAGETRCCETSHSSINLPRQLNSICKSHLVAASLYSLSITDCPRLKTLPFFHADIDRSGFSGMSRL